MPDRTAFVEQAATKEIIRLVKIPYHGGLSLRLRSFGFSRFWTRENLCGDKRCCAAGYGGHRGANDFSVALHSFPLKQEVCQRAFIIPARRSWQSWLSVYLSPKQLGPGRHIHTAMLYLVSGYSCHQAKMFVFCFEKICVFGQVDSNRLSSTSNLQYRCHFRSKL